MNVFTPIDSLSIGSACFLGIALLVAFGFEFVNGFHDTANAVATVIYTKSMRPALAVIVSGICNFLGVVLGGLGVAFTILHLLPVDLLVNIGSSDGLSMVAALLLAAIIWNLGTWWKGLPASSSHTLIGSIIGVGLANAILSSTPFSSSVALSNVRNVILSLLISPLIGFIFAMFAMMLLKAALKNREEYFAPADREGPPPLLMRGGVIASSIGVSFSHGANDGQKGIGLIMLILIGILPAHYALNAELKPAQIQTVYADLKQLDELLERKEEIINKMVEAAVTIPGGAEDSFVSPLIEMKIAPLRHDLGILLAFLKSSDDISKMPFKERWAIRTNVLAVDEAISDLAATGRLKLDNQERQTLLKGRTALRKLTDYAPFWVIFGVALSLGVGTMIGWKRIVVTIGEHIGKTPLSYSQGLSAQIVAAGTIMAGNVFGLPVSTTQVLSSGVAGTMTAQGSGLQAKTLRNIILAWILTLPASMFLAAMLYLAFRTVARIII